MTPAVTSAATPASTPALTRPPTASWVRAFAFFSSPAATPPVRMSW
jgi:hypothetical protein